MSNFHFRKNLQSETALNEAAEIIEVSRNDKDAAFEAARAYYEGNRVYISCFAGSRIYDMEDLSGLTLVPEYSEGGEETEEAIVPEPVNLPHAPTVMRQPDSRGSSLFWPVLCGSSAASARPGKPAGGADRGLLFGGSWDII